jgi:hypothetical protein
MTLPPAILVADAKDRTPEWTLPGHVNWEQAVRPMIVVRQYGTVGLRCFSLPDLFKLSDWPAA